MMYILYKDNDREALDIVLVRLPHVRTVGRIVQKNAICNLRVKFRCCQVPLVPVKLAVPHTHCRLSQITCSLSDT